MWDKKAINNCINKKAYTFVELLVVLVVIVFVSAIAFLSYQSNSIDSRNWTRLTDVNLIEESFEIHKISFGEYPIPDNSWNIYYEWELVWQQWNFWKDVLQNFSDSILNPILDPLSHDEYTYSITNSKQEFQILLLLEWEEVVFNQPKKKLFLNKTEAKSEKKYTPKIIWNYNKALVKTKNYVIPTPSIITAEYIPETWLILDNNNIKSVVLTWYNNIPQIWKISQNISAIPWLTLSVYSWSLYSDSDKVVKENIISKIKDTYLNSNLEYDLEIQEILNTSDLNESISILDFLIFKKER